jgi:hypothetical protein
MTRCLALVLVVLALAACGSGPASTPDLVATEVSVQKAAAATLTAEAPAEAVTPTARPEPLLPATHRPPKAQPLVAASEEAAAGAGPAQPATPVAALAQVGEQVEAGNWLLTVTEVQYHKALQSHSEANVAMGVYSVLLMDIQNQAAEPDHFGTLWWELHDAAGNVYEDDMATCDAASQFGCKDTPWDDLNPGQTAQIALAFDVPEGAKGLQLYAFKLGQPFVSIGDAQSPQDR